MCEREREREREREKTGDDKHEKETYQKKKEDLLTFGGKIIWEQEGEGRLWGQDLDKNLMVTSTCYIYLHLFCYFVYLKLVYRNLYLGKSKIALKLLSIGKLNMLHLPTFILLLCLLEVSL